MVEEMKCVCIRVRGCTNEWMNCIFLIDEKDKEIAAGVLEKVCDDLWDEGEDWCYGEFLETRLTEAGIRFDAYYAEMEDDSE